MNRSDQNSARYSGMAAAIMFAIVPATASAQTDERDRIVTLGVGAQIGPKHIGSDETAVFPLPFGKVRRPGDPMPFSGADDSTGLALINTPQFRAGPVLNFRAKRNERDVGAPVGNVGLALEPGMFVEGYPVEMIRLRAEARRGVTGHSGFVGDLAADYVIRSADRRLVAGVGPRVRLGDSRFERRYFGVDAAVAIWTGLAPFRPDGGVHAVGVQAAGHYQLTERWGVYGLAGYDRLTGNAAESPIVRAFGARGQFFAGVAATYTFGLRL